jgi:hypothetical protein
MSDNAAVEPNLLSAIDFLTNGTVNRIISDDRINCNVLALSYSLNLGQIQFISLYSIFLNFEDDNTVIMYIVHNKQRIHHTRY